MRGGETKFDPTQRPHPNTRAPPPIASQRVFDLGPVQRRTRTGKTSPTHRAAQRNAIPENGHTRQTTTSTPDSQTGNSKNGRNSRERPLTRDDPPEKGLPRPPALRPAREEIPSHPHPATPPAAPTAQRLAAQSHHHPLPCWPGWKVKGVSLLGFRAGELKPD